MAEIVGRINYNIDNTTYEKEAASRSDPFVTKFLDYMFVKDKVLRDCQASMTDTALVVFVERVVAKLSPALVKALKTKRFSEWGAMKLRQQVRLLQEQLVELIDGKGTLLPQFAVLDHMVTLLNLDSPADVQYVTASIVAPPPPPPPATVAAAANGGKTAGGAQQGNKGGGSGGSGGEMAPQRLTTNEVKQVLKLRVDFDVALIDRLKI
jgi:hypothetical protein